MPTFVYMTRCDGCGHCVDICPSDIMHIDPTVLFVSIPWSKFSHMFFKPAAALEKRVSKANGSAQNLPTLTRDDPEQQKRHSMELLRNAPMRMGLGIKREAPRHY